MLALHFLQTAVIYDFLLFGKGTRVVVPAPPNLPLHDFGGAPRHMAVLVSLWLLWLSLWLLWLGLRLL